MTRPSFTIGIEEELQVVDPGTRALRSHISEVLAEGKLLLHEQLSSELHHPVMELGSGICRDVTEARRDVTRNRSVICQLARQHGLRLAAAGTHPFTHWADVEMTAGNERYERLVYDLQMVARANLIFGLHVHIGVEDRETAIHLMNSARYFLPHIQALSVNSPFWLGRNTGWKSYRSKVFERFPRTGIPDYFGSWADFESYVRLLMRTNCMLDGKQIWWDIRPHPNFPTLEFRACDVPMRVEETIAIAAVIQAVTAKLWKLYSENLGFRLYRRALIVENKMRAARWGLDGKLIDFGKKEEVPTRELMEELLEFVDDVVDDLGSRQALAGVRRILEEGTGADRQLRVFEATGDLKAVVDYVCDETESGLDLPEVQGFSTMAAHTAAYVRSLPHGA
ncbi:MAG: carboxylate-amine ligase [Gemmatimonadetes bacterium]|nr:carboxylate-amine ligase [Gemmatimonadota bacterium]